MTACRESSTTYEAADGSKLPMLVFGPAAGMPPVAGVILFHGGALRMGSVDGLVPHCRRLASRGIFAVSAGYRLLGQGAVSIDDCVRDVRRAVEHFGRLATLQGIDASCQAWGGSSAGAHLALFAAMTESMTESMTASEEPGAAAIVAFNPAGLDLLAFPSQRQLSIEQQAGVGEGRLADYSLIDLVRPGNPRMLIHHGTDDEVEPIDNARRFRDAMVRAGNDCTLLEYEDAEHGFHYPAANGHFDNVIDTTARFLTDRS